MIRTSTGFFKITERNGLTVHKKVKTSENGQENFEKGKMARNFPFETLEFSIKVLYTQNNLALTQR